MLGGHSSTFGLFRDHVILLAVSKNATIAGRAMSAPQTKREVMADKWWERDAAPNMKDVHNVQELVDELVRVQAWHSYLHRQHHNIVCRACFRFEPLGLTVQGQSYSALYASVGQGRGEARDRRVLRTR